MLSVGLYRAVDTVYSLNFLENTAVPTVVVCPNPLIADEFGSRIGSIKNVNTITISKFISDKLSMGLDDLKVFRKSEYMAHLGTIFKKAIPEGTIDSFFQAFDLFTELRSFSLDFDYISEILNQFDPIVAKAIEYFWRYTDHVDLVDEHKAYRILAEAYREMDHQIHAKSRFINPCENIIFWGFSHLNAGQVDLVKALSIYHDVYIPFPESVYAKAQMSDWITWLHPKEKDVQQVEERRIDQLKVVHFAKKRLSEALLSYQATNNGEGDIFLCIKAPQFVHLSEISVKDSSFRAESDIFSDLFKMVTDASFEIIEEGTDVEFFRSAILERVATCVEEQNFRGLKVWGLLSGEVDKWRELSDDNTDVTPFYLELMLHIVRLNLPRVSSRPLIKNSASYYIRGLEGVSCYREERNTIVCVTSDYPGIRNVTEKFNDEVMQFLAATGPIRRGEFEFQILKNQLLDILSGENTVLFIEGGLREMDLAWDEILSSVDNLELLPLSGPERKATDDYLSKITTKQVDRSLPVSASRLQSFMDCKRKFYFDYLEKFGVDPEIEESLGARELGIIEHDIIDRYLKDKREWDSSFHRELVQKTMDEFLEKNLYRVETYFLNQYLQEIIDYTSHGICALVNILKIYPEAELYFEHKLPRNHGVTGSVDCLVKIGDEVGIIDFKRSGGGIPSQSEFKRFDKIQVWFYLNHLNVDPKSVLFAGFFNLSSIDESLIFIRDIDVLESFNEYRVLEGGKAILLKEPFELSLGEYAQFESEKITELFEESVFAPMPKNDGVCTFCTVANLCPRSV